MCVSIDTKGALVIFDEAHNVEDYCMECGSFEYTMEQLRNTADW